MEELAWASQACIREPQSSYQLVAQDLSGPARPPSALREAAVLRFCSSSTRSLDRVCSLTMSVALLTLACASSFALCFNLPFGRNK